MKNEDMTMYDVSLLHSRVDRLLRMAITSKLEKHKVTMMEWLLLSIIARHGKKTGVSMSFAANTLMVTLPQVTALTAGLIKSGLIVQEVSVKDRRSRSMLITQVGLDLLAGADADLAEVKDTWFSELADEEVKVFMAVLTKFLAHAKA